MISLEFTINNEDYSAPLNIDEEDMDAAREVVSEYLQQYLFEFNTPQVINEMIMKISDDNFMRDLIGKNIANKRDKKINQILK